jgi:hypothetical protein
MHDKNKPISRLTSRQKKELKRLVYALRGKYKGKGLLKAFLAEKKWEKEL